MGTATRETYLRRGEVAAVTGLSAATIDRLEARGQFAQRVRLGNRAVGWRQGEVAAWIASREVRHAHRR